MPELRKVRGKVNLTLDIIGTQGELHLIRSLFLKIPLETRGLFWKDPGLFRIENLDIHYTNSKAYKTYLKKPCSAYIFQSIPTGYGLGGSAADDALIASYTGVKPSSRDAYFLLDSSKLALVEGDQTNIKPLELPFPLELVVVFPPLLSETKEFYRRWDANPVTTDYTEHALRALKEGDKDTFESCFGNVFEHYLDTTLRDLREHLASFGPFIMTGSGSAFFAPLAKVKKYPDLPFRIFLIERWSPK